MVRRITGKPSPITVNHLKINNVSMEFPECTANTLGSNLSFNTYSAHFTNRFRRRKAAQDKRPIYFHSDNQETYNQLFSRTS